MKVSNKNHKSWEERDSEGKEWRGGPVRKRYSELMKVWNEVVLTARNNNWTEMRAATELDTEWGPPGYGGSFYDYVKFVIPARVSARGSQAQ